MRLIALGRAALAAGLMPGLTLADARARVPELVVADHDAAADAVLLDWLAQGCDRYTPMVATDGEDALILDVTGCAHPYTGGERGLADDLDARLAHHGLTARMALAHTPDMAAALARHAGHDVAALPVTALRVAHEVHVALSRAGLKTVGAVARIPVAALAARFGADLPVLLARLTGNEDVRITPRRTLPEVEVEARFAEPIGTVEAALGVIATLCAQAATQLNERGGGGRRFTVALFRSDGHVARAGVETAAPVRDPATVIRLLRERVGALADPLDPGFGYDLIRLGVPIIDPLAPEQLALEGGRVAETEMTALIDRLSARLGRGRVRRVVPCDTHIPEQAALELPAVAPRPAGAWPKAFDTPDPDEPPTRPIHMFDPPQRIEVIAEVPDGPPRRFRWRRAFHDVVRQEGPERIAAEWWTRADGAGATRDYYRIEDARGRRYWLFRHGLYGVEKANPDWYLHGVFA